MKFIEQVKLGVFITIAILVLGWRCTGFENTNITFINNSGIHVDSVLFSINNYKCKMVSILPNSTITKKIYTDSIRLNNHDITVGASLFVKGVLFRNTFLYNDLSGDLSKNYKLTLLADSTLQLIPEY